MLSIKLEGSATQKLTDLERKIMPKAVRASINRTVITLQKEIDVIVRKEQNINLKSKDVKARVSVSKARGNKTEDIRGQVAIHQKPIPLIYFMSNRGSFGRGIKTNKKSGKVKRQTVKVRVKKGGSAKTVRGAFIASMRSGHTGLYRRQGQKRLPVKELFSTSVRDVFRSATTIARLQRTARERYVREFSHQLRYYVSKAS